MTARPASGNGATSGPLYARIADTLRRGIADGQYPIGSQLPTEDRLCDQFGVSRHTIRDALRVLRDEKLILSRKRAGTVVAPQPSTDSNFIHAFSITDLIASAARWRFQMGEIGMAPLEADLAAWVKIDGKSEWLTFAGPAWIDGSILPDCWASYHVDRQYAAIGSLIRDRGGRILPLLETMFGVTVTSLVQDMSATALDASLATALQVEAGTTTIAVRRSYQTASGDVAMITAELYPASRFRYTTTLHREPPAGG